MPTLEFFQYPCLNDNYGVLVNDPESGDTAAIDVPDAAATLGALAEKGWNLTHIFVTHHHFDHVQGIAEVNEKYNCKIFGPAKESDRISGLQVTFDDGAAFEFGGEAVEVIATPGHTLGMINYYFTRSKVVFTGDTLFALGCGRIFEGDANMMWSSLEKLAALPPETQVYCGHEYTLSNARFALTVEPQNSALVERVKHIEDLRGKDLPTLPTTIGQELETNPFMRPQSPDIRSNLNMEYATDAEVFAEIRRRKDNA